MKNFPFLSFDLAFVLDSGVPVQKVESSLREHGGEELEHLALFDIYEGKNVGEGEKSLAFALRVRPTSETFTEEHLASYRAKIIDGVSKDCNARLRS